MSKLYARILFVICFAALFAACKKGDTGAAGATGATGPAGPAYTGAISGHVSLFDQYGTKVLTGLNMVSLSLNGAAAINPDTSGFYLYPANTGDYYITASASGFGATRADNFQFLADTLNKDIKLSAIPSFSPVSFVAYEALSTEVPGDSLILTFNPDPRARECIVFMGNTPAVNNLPANFLLVYTRAINGNLTNNQSKITISVPTQDLSDAGFVAGDTVYYAAYGYVVGDVSVYEDVTTGKNVYNAVSSSSLLATVVVP